MDLFSDVPLRSLRFIPGNSPFLLEDALHCPADALIPDLEDTVPLAEKENARKIVADALPTFAYHSRTVIPRINSLDSGLAEPDLEAIVSPDIWGINIGKTEKPADMVQIDNILSLLERKRGIEVGTIKVIPLLESALALINAYPIAISSSRIVGLAFGAEDFTKDMGIERTDLGKEIEHPRYVISVAARAANIKSFDTPLMNFENKDSLEHDIKKAISIGYSGKLAIHASQVTLINQLFVPSLDQIQQAKQIIDAAEKAELEGKGSTSLDGKMIDVPIVERAKKLLAKYRGVP